MPGPVRPPLILGAKIFKERILEESDMSLFELNSLCVVWGPMWEQIHGTYMDIWIDIFGIFPCIHIWARSVAA